jgi:hypothetical protein
MHKPILQYRKVNDLIKIVKRTKFLKNCKTNQAVHCTAESRKAENSTEVRRKGEGRDKKIGGDIEIGREGTKRRGEIVRIYGEEGRKGGERGTKRKR